MENPEDPGEDPYPSQFATKEAQELRDDYEGKDYLFDQCPYDLIYKKGSQLLSDVEAMQEIEVR